MLSTKSDQYRQWETKIDRVVEWIALKLNHLERLIHVLQQHEMNTNKLGYDPFPQLEQLYVEVDLDLNQTANIEKVLQRTRQYCRRFIYYDTIASTKVLDSSNTSTKVLDSSNTSTKVLDSSNTSTKVLDSSNTSTKVLDSSNTSMDMMESYVISLTLALLNFDPNNSLSEDKKKIFTLFDVFQQYLSPYIQSNDVMKLICDHVDISTIEHTTNAENRSNLQKACQYILFYPEYDEWDTSNYTNVMNHLRRLHGTSYFEKLKYVYNVTDTYDYDEIIVSLLRQCYPYNVFPPYPQGSPVSSHFQSTLPQETLGCFAPGLLETPNPK
jgi:hypothetical protein